jgi:protein O-GlcNAc transferase
MTIDQMLQQALQHQNAGRVAAAEGLYRQILGRYPNQPDAWHLLGTLAYAGGNVDIALEYIGYAISLRPAAEYYFNYGNMSLAAKRVDEAITSLQKAVQLKSDLAEAHYALGLAFKARGLIDDACKSLLRAVAINPAWAEAWNSLGVLLKSKGDLKGAVEAYREAIRLNANFEDACSNLGNALKEQAKLSDALAVYRKALQINPASVTALNAIGMCLSEQGLFNEAIAAFHRAILLKPDHADLHCNLGIALMESGKLEEAIAADRRAIELNPSVSDVHNNLGIALNAMGRCDEAIEPFRHAIKLNPTFWATYNNMGIALQDLGRYDEAIASYRRAVELNPDSAQAYNNLELLKNQGLIEEGVASLRRAVALEPKAADIHSNLLFDLNFLPQYPSQRISEEAKAWAQRHTPPLLPNQLRYANDRSSDRCLKIGYVSPDFTAHAVGRFMVPVMDHHDHEKYEIHCFSSVSRPDETTEWFRRLADHWYDIRGQSDRAVVELIRGQKIDILVDLALHTRGNRLLVFAQKPAPVQATFLAYCGTSGMEMMDYLIADPYLLPPGEEKFICETPVRLPSTYWCFRPLPATPDVNLLPAQSGGGVTFGCLNSYGKVNSEVLSLWGQILKAVPDSRLLLHAAEGSHRQRARDQLANMGVDPNRLDFEAYVPFSEYFQQYHEIDIALDPFPFAGGTTTCDALWMGVPVISLAGNTTVSRGGLSILTNAGLPELVAKSVEEYIRIAVDLAADLPRLAHLRATMRERMQHSPLMNEKRYVADLEAAYRMMWRNWCEQS